jgi:predicted  nucleic acid-binding Zn-ribbon protein
METKEELVNLIKEWIKLDNEIIAFQKEMKERKEKKKQMSEMLMSTMKKNNLDCFDINGGSLLYKKNKIKKPLNGKTLMTALNEYYKSNPQTA